MGSSILRGDPSERHACAQAEDGDHVLIGVEGRIDDQLHVRGRDDGQALGREVHEGLTRLQRRSLTIAAPGDLREDRFERVSDVIVEDPLDRLRRDA